VRAVSVGLIDFLVDRRRLLLLLVLVVSVGMAMLAAGLEVDRGLDALTDRGSDEYRAYRQFLDSFGSDDLIIVALHDRRGAEEPRVLESLLELTGELERLEGVAAVTSLANLRLPADGEGFVDMAPLVAESAGSPVLDLVALERARRDWPFVKLLVSADLESLGLVVRMAEAHASPQSSRSLIVTIRQGVQRSFPQKTELHLTGSPVLMEAFYQYNIQTTFIFGGLASLIGAVLLMLIFRSWWMPLVVYPISGLAAVWGAGLLAAVGARLNVLSGLCFGFVFVVTTATVVHLVAAYQSQPAGPNAVRQALRIVGRPCLMCALTTAAGFASIMVSPLAAVRQFGMVMSLATLVSFVLTLVLGPVFLPLLKTRSEAANNGFYASVVAAAGKVAFRYPAFCLAAGLLLVVIALAGMSLIKLDINMLSMFRDGTPEVRALRFVEERLAPITGLEVMISGPDGAFLEESSWQRVRAFEKRLTGMEGVAAIDSILPLLERRLAAVAPTFEQDFPGEPALARMLTGIAMHADGQLFVRNYVADNFSRLRLSARVRGEDQRQLSLLLRQLNEVAREELGMVGDVSVTGSLSFFDTQFRELVRAQVLSLLIALSVIILLMMVQFRSAALGLLSLIPNLFPALMVLGLMGWAGIPFSGITVLVAAIALGLSADDTIHYLTHFRDALHGDAAEALEEAYRRTGKALLSTSLVLAASLGVLVFAPLRPSVFFGVLISAAVVAAWAADVMLMPSLLLASGRIRRIFEGRFEG
jgi:predicted RND superfamily exporter protein